MSIATDNLSVAREAYRIATDAYHRQRDAGGIVELDRTDPRDEENLRTGQRWKCVTPAGRMALGHWQKAKAELDAAAESVKREAPNFNEPHRAPPVPDRRLPPERDDSDSLPF